MKTDALTTLLFSNKKKRFTVIELGGNIGDQLICMGLKRKLRETGIEFSSMSWPDWLERYKIVQIKHELNQFLDRHRLNRFVKVRFKEVHALKIDGRTDIALIEGGGSFNDLWRGGLFVFEEIIKSYPEIPIIVAPQTYWFNETDFEEILKDTSSSIDLFCREKYSLNLLRGMNLPDNVKIHVSRDTAFYLTEKDFPKGSASHNLVCFRRDKESALSDKTKQNVIDSLKGKTIIRDLSCGPCNERYFAEFGHMIAASEQVYTDRLHVAIVATILGKRVTFFANSYYKNKGVYEYSLRDFPNVTFVDAS